MFTIMFHNFEVLASNPSGQTVKQLHALGSCWTKGQIRGNLQALEKEGYVKSWKEGKSTVWTLTDKAKEYISRDARLIAQNNPLEEF